MGDGAENSPEPVLIATKLRPPSMRDQVIPRDRLAERLRAGAGLGLSLLAAQALERTRELRLLPRAVPRQEAGGPDSLSLTRQIPPR